MKKLILVLMIFLTACSNSNVDTVSSATEKWESGQTEANAQFSKLEAEKGGNSDKVTSVREGFVDFLNDQFWKDNITNRNFENLEFVTRSDAMLSNSSKEHHYIIRKQSYNYDIKIRKFDNKIENDTFIKEMTSRDSSLKTIDTNIFDKVLVKNLNGSYSSALGILYNKNDESYYINFESNQMSIPEILVLAEKFFEFVK